MPPNDRWSRRGEERFKEFLNFLVAAGQRRHSARMVIITTFWAMHGLGLTAAPR
jgi:hypothetical protein